MLQVLVPIMTGVAVLTAVLRVEAASGDAVPIRPEPIANPERAAPLASPTAVPESPEPLPVAEMSAPGALVFLDLTLPPPPPSSSASSQARPPDQPKPERVADFAKPTKPEVARPQRIDPQSIKPISPVSPDEEPKTKSLMSPKTPETSTPSLTMPTVKRIERVVRPSRRDTEIGGEILTVMERGEGPGIRIGWPARKAGRDKVRALLERCADRRLLLSAAGALWSIDGEPSESWTPPREVSGYMRILDGTEEAVARDLIDRIRQRHNIAGGQTVAVVSRAFDARLLGGLAALVGRETLERKSVGGRYRVEGDRLKIVDISVEGTTVPGAVEVVRGGRC
jgi:hypothetical protein